MPKTKPSKPRNLPAWANEPLTFNISPDETLLRCAFSRLPTSRKKSVKTRLKSR